jgi:hypothetical protein
MLQRCHCEAGFSACIDFRRDTLDFATVLCGHPKISDAIPHPGEIGRVDEENVCRQDFPLKKLDVQGILQPEVKSQANGEQRITKPFHPNESAHAEFEDPGKPCTQFEHHRVEKPRR